MNFISVVWPMLGATSLTLAGVHLMVWLGRRESWAHLLFAVTALSGTAVALIELALMGSDSTAEFGHWLRWLHVPTATLIICLVWFIRFHTRSGRGWLAWTITGLRILILVINFVTSPNATYGEITSMEKIGFLGAQVAVAEGTPHALRFIIHLSSLLLLVYAIDAAIHSWRRKSRPSATLIGAATAAAVISSVVFSQLMLRGVVPAAPLAMNFLLIVLAMAHELSQDLIRARQQSAKLHESRKRMDLAAQAADLRLWEWDIERDRVWTTWDKDVAGNTAAHQLSTLDQELEFVYEEDREMVRRAVIEAARSGADLDVEHRLHLPGEAVRWVATHGRVERDSLARPLFFRGVSRDITREKEMLAENVRQREALLHLQRVSLLEQISSALAHELSQPLGAILRNADAAELFLKKGDADEKELLAILSDIREDDQRAVQVIKRIRDLLRPRSADFASLDIATVIRDVQAILLPEFQSRGVALRIAVAPDLPAIYGDRIQLQQVLLNLMVNGLEAMSGSPRTRGVLEVNAGPGPDHGIMVEVVDQGTGISEDALPHIFDPFVTTKEHGIGIGLSICKTILQTHGGAIQARNNDGAGCTVRFTLPPHESRSGGGA